MITEPKNDFLRWRGLETEDGHILNAVASDLFYPLDVLSFTENIRSGERKLMSAEIWPVGYCNNRCNFCSSDIYKIKSKSSLNVEKLKAVTDELCKVGVGLIRFSGGGEPFLLKDFYKIVEYVGKKKLNGLYITNGIELCDRDIKALARNANLVRISLNAATEMTYKTISGTDSFKKIIDNIKKLQKERSSADREKQLIIGLNFIVTNDNYREISLAAKLAYKMRLDFIIFRGLNPAICRFDKKSLEIIKEQCQKAQSYTDNDLIVKCVYEKVTWVEGKKVLYEKCFASDFRVFIDSKGDVYPCCSAIQSQENNYGNIQSKSFFDIWKSQKTISFRKKLNDGKHFDYCSNFCDRVEFNEFVDWTKNELRNNQNIKFKKIENKFTNKTKTIGRYF